MKIYGWHAIGPLLSALALAACGGGSATPDGGGGPDAASLDQGMSDDGGGGDFTLRTIATINLPGVPKNMTFNTGTQKLYLVCVTPPADLGAFQTSAGIAVVDAATKAVVANIANPNIVGQLAANGSTKRVYAAEFDQVDVIDSTTDTVTTKVTDPGHEGISGLAVDEMHDLVYLVTSAKGAPQQSHVYVLDGATNQISNAPYTVPVQVVGGNAPPIAVDPMTQEVFVLGVDANFQAVIVTLDGTTGALKPLLNTTSAVSINASGVFAIGNGNAAATLINPSGIQIVDPEFVPLPAGITPVASEKISFKGNRNLEIGGTDANGSNCIAHVPIQTPIPTIPLLFQCGVDYKPGYIARNFQSGAVAADGFGLYIELVSDSNTGVKNEPPLVVEAFFAYRL